MAITRMSGEPHRKAVPGLSDCLITMSARSSEGSETIDSTWRPAAFALARASLMCSPLKSAISQGGGVRGSGGTATTTSIDQSHFSVLPGSGHWSRIVPGLAEDSCGLMFSIDH